MGHKVKLIALLLLCVFQQGVEKKGGQCSMESMEISEEETGVKLGDAKEYKVVMRNTCGSNCVQSSVVVYCEEITSVYPVDPDFIKPVDDWDCTVCRGGAIYSGEDIVFKYAWPHSHNIHMVSSDIKCT